jgi:hypothetical protein
MGDWCGSAWVCWPKNQQDRSSGRGTEGKNEAVLVGHWSQAKKKRGFFSYGEVLFLLTSPLIECLSSAVEILLVPRKIQETVEVGVDETSTKQLMKVKEMAALSEMSL